MDSLKLRNERKKRKPAFERQYANVKKQFESRWKRPRGIHSKMRKGFRGKKLLPAVGYRSPADTRGLLRTGLKLAVVANVSALEKINPKEQAVFLQAGLGVKKRIEILNKAIQMKINIANVKDAQKFIDEAKKKIEERKKRSADTKNKKEEKKEEVEKKKEEKKPEEEKEKKAGKEEKKQEKADKEEKKAEEQKEKKAEAEAGKE